MKTITMLLISMLLLNGCAMMKRHPVVSGLVVGAAVGIGVGIVSRPGHCPNVYEGQPYSGTPPCPGPEALVKRTVR